jgi:hypothetical protein
MRKFSRWIFETKCRRCGELNEWIISLNDKEPTEKKINFHIYYYNENPFEIKWCENCKMLTRQEWICLYEKLKVKK